MELKNRVIVITGAGQGLGRQFALDCVAKGARVALGDYNHESAESVAKECTAAGGEASSYVVDVTNEEQVVNFYSRVMEDFGTLDATINNAGILRDNLLVKERDGEVTGFPLKKWQAVIDTNLTGVFLCGREAAVNLVRLKKSGVIINISSILGLTGLEKLSAYCASKGAVRLFTKAVALECGRDGSGIRVNSIHPGYIHTAMMEDTCRRDYGNIAKGLAELGKLHPIGRVGEPEEIAAGVLYLASDESKFITGSELAIDGGYTAV